ncbi:MAG: hypothetical protein LBT27_07255, partial [Prevotellaceae bacterium]|nr:hypothetical protein [Prevotellaceae bacterium]
MKNSSSISFIKHITGCVSARLFVTVVCCCATIILNAQENHFAHNHDEHSIAHSDDYINELQAEPISGFCTNGQSICGINIADNMGAALLFTGSAINF